MQKRHVFLVPPSYKTKQQREKENVPSSVFLELLLAKKKKKKKADENTLRKFMSELDERKTLNFQVIVACSAGLRRSGSCVQSHLLYNSIGCIYNALTIGAGSCNKISID